MTTASTRSGAPSFCGRYATWVFTVPSNKELYEGQELGSTSLSVVDWITPRLSMGPLDVLGPLSEADWHENGWVVGGSGFHEWVGVGETGLKLIVASDDWQPQDPPNRVDLHTSHAGL